MKNSRRNLPLPEDIQLEILPRLPVRTLLRFRAVCKSWRSLIDDPGFARRHLLCFHNNRHETHLAITCNTDFHVRCTRSLQITATFFLDDYHGPSSSLDGLFLMTNSRNSSNPTSLTLWNPATRETRILPPCPETLDGNNLAYDLAILGLGFDPLINDYKCVKILYNTLFLYSILVYSLATNSWNNTPIGFDLSDPQGDPWGFRWYKSSSLCLRRGALLFFLATRFYSPCVQLVSFDLRSETFTYSTKLPVEDVYDDTLVQYGPFPIADGDDDPASLMVISLSATRASGCVWALEGVGADDTESWTLSKLYAFASMLPTEFDPLADMCEFFYLNKDGDLFLDWPRWDDRVTSYNLKTREEKTVSSKSFGKKAWPYVESLIKLN